MSGQKNLVELFDRAAAGGGEVDLGDGLKVSRLGMAGDLVVDGRSLQYLPPSTVEMVAKGLERAGGAHLDPAKNPMIKLGDD